MAETNGDKAAGQALKEKLGQVGVAPKKTYEDAINAAL